MSDTLNVYEVGTKVMLTKDIEAVIITISIHSGNMVQYECSWWSGLTRTRDWFDSKDFFKVGENNKTIPIGFSRS
tara:strand:+ start:6196 stop:6420 length:225 start_codon:yes stop_codon:yes gene_type:complete